MLLLQKETSLSFCEKYPRKQQDIYQGMKKTYFKMGNGATVIVINIGANWNGKTQFMLENGKKTDKWDSSAKYYQKTNNYST